LKEIEGAEALQVLRQSNRLDDFHVGGRLHINLIGDPITFPLSISNCVLDEFYSPVVWYREPVEIAGCTFKNAFIHAVYFIKGLSCRDTDFLGQIDWSAGGHNSIDTPVLFERVKFHKFVDFFDCWFTGPVVLRNVEFLEGTNLMNPDHGWVNFEVPPVLENVRGRVDANLNIIWKDGSVSLTDRSPKFFYPDEKQM
jgi:hypothetical protein